MLASVPKIFILKSDYCFDHLTYTVIWMTNLYSSLLNCTSDFLEGIYNNKGFGIRKFVLKCNASVQKFDTLAECFVFTKDTVIPLIKYMNLSSY